jgi:uncharacterized membrane protein (UPF0127 family)
MSRKIMKPNNQKISSKTKPCQLAVVAIGAIAGLALMFIRRFLYRFLHFFSTPVFMKEGEVALIRRGRTNAVMINVEIADTQERREIGLMGRPKMEELQGMLFIFEEEQPLSFWMMNTLLSLDVFFVDADGTINTIHRSTAPYSLKTYRSHRPGQFVLETNAGFADKYNVTEGDRIIWTRTK